MMSLPAADMDRLIEDGDFEVMAIGRVVEALRDDVADLGQFDAEATMNQGALRNYDQDQAIARRVAACWNLFRGTSTAELERALASHNDERPMTEDEVLPSAFEHRVSAATGMPKRQVVFDNETTGLALIVSPRGKKSYSIVARNAGGKQVWKKIGEPGSMALLEARRIAAAAVAQIKSQGAAA